MRLRVYTRVERLEIPLTREKMKEEERKKKKKRSQTCVFVKIFKLIYTLYLNDCIFPRANARVHASPEISLAMFVYFVRIYVVSCIVLPLHLIYLLVYISIICYRCDCLR